MAHYHYTDSSIHWVPFFPFYYVLSFCSAEELIHYHIFLSDPHWIHRFAFI
ncbi:hypothetical protein TOT_020000184 [Theileria orientalis strain Shintoku]|uniref:Uncharacterized protein n=1 Tax=Theileria orientalis strain Shintoku TaxID=869250 RepID=J4C7Z8_THEOR|nr:hypothetical protein TOT_020000184 [Theileria orientalis strain Shintoku]PVC50152.1 hypothetical protein MACL_00002490 [Theileria orientalis]BAM39913.1 hypothetical protein TOT_020000184 [Theileria orientalis strain Shintoku]|eukprot:XP_009690214.1 hypothetical protein TOT_020000184 [Theileria orientalis strain Shintoku]